MKPATNFQTTEQTNKTTTEKYKLNWEEMSMIRGGNEGNDPLDPRKQ